MDGHMAHGTLLADVMLPPRVVCWLLLECAVVVAVILVVPAVVVGVAMLVVCGGGCGRMSSSSWKVQCESGSRQQQTYAHSPLFCM